MARKKTWEDHVADFKRVHGDRYEYPESQVLEESSKTKIKITCNVHGSFEQRIYKHKAGDGCPFCAGRGETTQGFIARLRDVHGNQYDYSKVKYLGINKEIDIRCNVHGWFSQLASNHLKGKGCFKCGVSNRTQKRTKPNDEFIKNCKAVHKGKYDYSSTIYKNSKTPVVIICPTHGEFEKVPTAHLSGAGCQMCSRKEQSEKARKIGRAHV